MEGIDGAGRQPARRRGGAGAFGGRRRHGDKARLEAPAAWGGGPVWGAGGVEEKMKPAAAWRRRSSGERDGEMGDVSLTRGARGRKTVSPRSPTKQIPWKPPLASRAAPGPEAEAVSNWIRSLPYSI